MSTSDSGVVGLFVLETCALHITCRIDGSTVASRRQNLIGEINSFNSETFISLISTQLRSTALKAAFHFGKVAIRDLKYYLSRGLA